MKIKSNPVFVAVIIIVIIVLFIAIGTIVFLALNGSLGDINSALNGEGNTSGDGVHKLLMSVEDVKTSSGSLIAYGTVEKGRVSVGDEVQIVGLNAKSKKVTVKGIEIVKRSVNYVDAVQSNVGVKFDVQEVEIQKGQAITSPNSISAHRKFEATVTVLETSKNKKETVLTNNMKTAFRVRNVDFSGTLNLLDNKQSAESGEKDVKVQVNLNDDIALEKGSEFYIVSSGKTIARGTVTKVY